MSGDSTTPTQAATRNAFRSAALVERGLICGPATVLFGPRKRRYAAKVRADGSIDLRPRIAGSIHKVGAAVQGAPACNGWTFWYFETADQPAPIDLLRQKVRSELAES